MNDPQPAGDDHLEEDDALEIRFNKVDASRLKMFSDAVWSIVATLMIVPIIHIKLYEELKADHNNINIVAEKIFSETLLYFLAFLIICSTWNCHVWTFQTMKYVTDLSIVVNLIVLLAASFLPYFYSLMSRFQTWPTVVIYSSIQIAIGVIQISLVLHAFSYPGVLNPTLDCMSDEDKKRCKRKIIKHLLVAPFYCIIAIGVSFASAKAGIICLALILIHPWMQSLLVCLCSYIPAIGRKEKKMLKQELLLTERVKKKRIESFSDGVFAITATLLVLDISEKYLPSTSKVEISFENDATKALAANWGVYIGYFLAFIIIGLHWYIDLTLFENMIQFSRVMQLIHNLSLACIGMIPVSFSFISHFKLIPAIRMGIQYGGIVLFCIGVFNSVVYILGLIFDRCNRPSGDKWMDKDIQPGGSDFRIMMFQLTAIPIGSLVVFGLSFLTNVFISVYFGVASILLYVIVLVLWKSIVSSLSGNDDSDSPVAAEYRLVEEEH